MQDAALAIISFTDSQAYKKEKKQNEQPESESTDSLVEVTAYLEYLKNQKRKVDRLRLNVRQKSRECFSWVQHNGDAQDFADLVNVGYGKVTCISLSTAGGIGEENDEEIRNRLGNIQWFLGEQHEGRKNRWLPSLQPLLLLARMT
ncbi:MAG: hypothetical protein EZS28_049163, partial [Streblomastix strix]